MQISITVTEHDGDLEDEQLKLSTIVGVDEVELLKVNSKTQTIFDTLNILFSNPSAAAAIGAGIGALLSSFGPHSKITIKGDDLSAINVGPAEAVEIVKVWTRKPKP